MTWFHDTNGIYGADKELVELCQRSAGSEDAFWKLGDYQDANHGGGMFLADFAQVRFAAFPEMYGTFEMFKGIQHQITQG